MILRTINCSTGPVQVADEVKQAFLKSPVSHRSEKFRMMMNETTGMLCDHFQVANAYILTGSGTMANEAMLWQIWLTGKRGLIVSNGEFGERLISQAQRIGIDYEAHKLEWGSVIDANEIASVIDTQQLQWILLCHCETSTGVLNPLKEITSFCNEKRVMVFADCTSTVGTRMIDLSKISMATCSSGKGLSCFPGLAIVLSNIEPVTSGGVPVYADLHQYHHNRIPFTISSNMVDALRTAIRQKLVQQQYNMIAEFSGRIRSILKRKALLVFDDAGSAVVTFCIPSKDLIAELESAGVVLSYESSYLKKRNWVQLALFGNYNTQELQRVITILSDLVPVQQFQEV